MDLQERTTSRICSFSHDLGVVQHMRRHRGHVPWLIREWRTRYPVHVPRPSLTPIRCCRSSAGVAFSQGRTREAARRSPSPIDLKPGCRFNTHVLCRVCRHEPGTQEDRGQPFGGLPSGQGQARPASAGRGVEDLTAVRAGIGIAHKRGIPSFEKDSSWKRKD